MTVAREMLSDLDLWRAANVIIKRYGDGAATEAAMRADEFLDQGNLDSKRLWIRIMQAIEELQREWPPGLHASKALCLRT